MEYHTQEWATNLFWGSLDNHWQEHSFGIEQLIPGLDALNYIGKNIRIKRIGVWGWFKGGQSIGHLADDESNFIRIVIARWDGQQTLTPLETLGATISTRINRSAQTAFRGLRKKYCDRMMLLRPNRTIMTSEPEVTQHFGAFKFFHKEIRFRGAGYKQQYNNINSRITISIISDAILETFPSFILGHVVMSWTDA